MSIPLSQTTVFEFEVDLQGMAATSIRTADVNGREMLLPQGGHIVGGYVLAPSGTPGVIAVGYPSGAPVTDEAFASNHNYAANEYQRISRSASRLPVSGKEGLAVRITNRTTPIPAGSPVILRVAFKLAREYE